MKMLNKQFPGVRDGMNGREVINDIVRIFQDVEKCLKTQMRSGNGRKHYTSFVNSNDDCKINNEKQWMSSKSLHF